MSVHPVGYTGCCIFRATGQRDVRMEGANVELKAGGKQSIVDALAQLKQSGVPGARSDPEHSGRTIRRKRADAFERQNEGADLYTRQPPDCALGGFWCHIAEKAQRHMQLPRIAPRDAWQRLREAGE